MQKLEAAVIPMQKISDDLVILNEVSLEDILAQEPFYYFDINVIDYLNEVSKALFRLKEIKSFPDLLTFAFFCRKSNIIALKKQYANCDQIKIGRGLVFHITPSNVPLNFAYSFVSGMLSGNFNIVRVPSKDFKQVELFFKALKCLNFDLKTSGLSKRTLFVKYERTSKATEYFSSLCDVRIIWGGDSTIQLIRKNAIPSHSIDITFADRFSFSVINAKEYLNFDDKQRLAVGFFNDTYLFDQNACTSPHIVFWYGSDSDVLLAKEEFWNNLYNLVVSRYQISAITGIDKMTNYFSFKTIGVSSKVEMKDNFLWRIELDTLPQNIDSYKGNSGYFFEYTIVALDEIAPIISQRYQTMAYFGFNKAELETFILNNNFKGIDRIVPVGKTSEFTLTWDGYNLIEHLTRSIQIL